MAANPTERRSVGQLVGRERERALLKTLLEEARAGRSRVLVIRGEPGVGKTALLDLALALAGDAHVLRCRGVESESELAFSGLAELLRPAVGLVDEIPEPQREALSAVLALAPTAVTERFAAYLGVLSLLGLASRTNPLLVLVDDSHWLDGSSAEAISFVARRLQAEAITLVITIREGEPSSFEAAGFEELVLTGLDPAAAEELLLSHHPELSPVALAELIQSSAGNPLALRELPRFIRHDQLEGTVPTEPLRGGPLIERAFLSRIRDLPSRTQRALLVASAGASDSARTIVRAMTKLGLSSEALEAAEGSGLLAAQGDRLIFDHPLVRSAVYHAATPSARRAAHQALADALVGDEDQDLRAWHRAAAARAPDEAVAAELEAAALRARTRAGHAAAAVAFERAARFSQRRKVRARRLYEAGAAAGAAGKSEHALALLAEALESTDAESLRADIQHLRGRLLMSKGARGVGDLLLAEGLRAVNHNQTKGTVMVAEAIGGFIWEGQPQRLSEASAIALQLPWPKGGVAELFVKMAVGFARVAEGRCEEGRPLALSAAADLERDPRLLAEPRIGGFVGQLLYVVEEFDRARALLKRVTSEARTAAALPGLAYGLTVLGITEMRAGRWAAASAALHEAVELTRLAGSLSDHAFSVEMLARLEAAQGKIADSRAHAEIALEISRTQVLPLHSILAYSALGFLELSQGRAAEAVHPLREGVRVLEETGRSDAIQQPYLTPDLVEAYVRAGAGQKAEHALASYEPEAQRTGVATARAASLRCRGLLAPEAAFERSFRQALAAHDDAPCLTPFEVARTRLCFGERLRRARRRGQAREELEEALAVFEHLGAHPWAEKARAELELAGRRTTRPRRERLESLLTTQELRVALTVGSGARNREAAAQLFLSPKTIENHLRHIFAKLGIRSRAELARMVALHERDQSRAGVDPPR
jgi:DNA-binding CsgD family transcriptional regulator